jgi:hypothetical protein
MKRRGFYIILNVLYAMKRKYLQVKQWGPQGQPLNLDHGFVQHEGERKGQLLGAE